MNVMAGYTIFSDKSATGSIPSIIPETILKTTAVEIETYVKLLTTEMEADLPDLCDYDQQTGIDAMTKAVEKMADCKELSGFACQRYAFITTC